MFGEKPAERSNEKCQAMQVPPAQTTTTLDDIDSLIAKEMNSLSIKEREKALEDVHGVAVVEEEDPAFVNARLKELGEHLNAIKINTDAYVQAEAMSSDYVSENNFRLMFLRADNYDSKEAAERMIRFFELKKYLFGVDKIVKDITLDDLNEDDMDTLKSGYAQVSPCKDMSGRTIVLLLSKLRAGRYKVAENVQRALYYLLMAVFESPEAQKRGIVVVYYIVDVESSESLGGSVRKSLLFSLGSVHLCVNDRKYYLTNFVPMKLFELNTKNRVRYRTHLGSHVECQYALASFGIPQSALPVTQEGHYSTYQHMIWLERRREIEAERVLSDRRRNVVSSMKHGDHSAEMAPEMRNGISRMKNGDHSVAEGGETVASQTWSTRRVTGLTPRPEDVLFGRGKPVIEHPGNTRVRQVVDFYRKKYATSGMPEKTRLTEIIMHMVQVSAGRFLKREDGINWEEVDDDTAREKVARTFRNRRRLDKTADL